MTIKLSTRGWVRLISYLVALIVVLLTFSIINGVGYKKARITVENSYSRSLCDLSDSLANISTTLTKSIYVGTDKQILVTCSKLWRDSSTAKQALSVLPIKDLSLENTYKFISQVGEYALSLTKTSPRDYGLTDTERSTLKKLSEYGKGLSDVVYQIKNDIENNNILISDLENFETADTDGISYIADGFAEMENGFDDYPTLIYDGPFSDNILTKKSAILASSTEITRQYAKEKFAKIINCDEDKVFDETDTDGNMPLYCFNATVDNGSTLYGGVTKSGGYLAYLINNRVVDKTNISVQKAKERGANFIYNLGLTGFTVSYYSIRDNVCSINYLYTQDTALCYPDIIKIQVALDNGEIIGYDSRSYITNHVERTKGRIPKITKEEAQNSVSDALTISMSVLCYIPTQGGEEVFCYQFTCIGENDQKVLVYVNADTGAEEQILILSEDENGVLTQ